ncbi:hypothetical protein SVIOM342S_08977 [Streptomyces violaceorubidus]
MYVFLLGALLLGMIAKLSDTSGNGYDYRSTIAPLWSRSLFTLNPRTELMEGVPVLYHVHAVVGMVLIALVPYTRLVHMFSAPAVPDPAVRGLPVARPQAAGAAPGPAGLGARGLLDPRGYLPATSSGRGTLVGGRLAHRHRQRGTRSRQARGDDPGDARRGDGPALGRGGVAHRARTGRHLAVDVFRHRPRRRRRVGLRLHLGRPARDAALRRHILVTYRSPTTGSTANSSTWRPAARTTSGRRGGS